MKKIYEWALNHVEVPAKVIKAVDMLRPEHAERFVEVVIGCDVDDNDVPQEFYYEDKVHTLVRCNYVLDQIIYTTVDTSYRYFDNQEDADKYAINGDYHWNKSSSNATEQYTIKGAWTRPVEHETYYSRWFAWAKVKFEE